MGWTIEQKRRYANAMHHLDNVMFEMRQCIDTPNGDEVGIYNSANELRKKVESESQKAETSDEALPIGDVVWRSEQLCEGLHSTDFNGKCFKCGEQVFVREPK